MVKLNIKPAFRQSNDKVEMKQFPTETSLQFGVQKAIIFYTTGLLSSKNVILRQAQTAPAPSNLEENSQAR